MRDVVSGDNKSASGKVRGADISLMRRRFTEAVSSFIQTILSVPELHRFMPEIRLADFTADREFHPAPKTEIYELTVILYSTGVLCQYVKC